MVEPLLQVLLVQTGTLSLAVVSVRAMQAIVAHRLGAGAAYLCWLLVPAAMLAVALPHPAGDALVVRIDVAAIAPAWVTAPMAVQDATHLLAAAIAATWAIGVFLVAGVLLRSQRRFEQQMSSRSDDAVRRLPAGTGPAVLGVLRPRIVLPQDFDSAYDAEERRLMLLHEGVHLRRNDNAWNLVASALLALHWFNPFAWWASRRLRADQEMACDAAVLREEAPAALATYAGALLKVQGVALAPPLATSWQSTHPLVERVRMLQVHRISSARHRTGLRLAALTVLLAGIGGYTLRAGANAVSAAGATSIMTELELKSVSADGSTTSTIAAKLLSRDGQKVRVRFDPPGMKQAFPEPIEIGLTTTRLDTKQLQMDVTLLRGEPPVELSSPRVVTIDGTPARVEVKSNDGGYHLVLTLVPRVVRGDPVMTPATNDVRRSRQIPG